MANGQTAYLILQCNLTVTLPILLAFVLLATFFLSGFRLAERSALWILLWGLGSFTILLLFTD